MRAFWGLITAAGLWAAALPAPAEAWGSFTHVWIAERAYGVLVTREPWLAAHRDAFLWGTIAADLDTAPDLGRPSRARTHSRQALQTLWKEARATKDQATQAFTLGWAVHVCSDEIGDQLFRSQALRDALTHAGATHLPADLRPLAEFAVDAALVPRSNGTQFELFRSIVMNAGTPADAPLRGTLSRVFGIDEATYMSFARLQAGMSAGTIDRYLEERAKFSRVEPWAEQLRTPAVRQALGELKPVMAHTVDVGIKCAQELADAGKTAPVQKYTPKKPPKQPAKQ